MHCMKMKCLVVLLASCAFADAADEVVIFPRDLGTQINRMFYDLKSPGAPRKFVRGDWAKTLLVDYDFNGLRTSIYGTGEKPAHPAPGVVVEKFYDAETKAMKLAKKIRPDTLIFASKKLDNKDSFPEWTKDGGGVIPKQYAILLIDYLEYMKRNGLQVDVLGVDNERRFNEGNIMPRKHRDIVLELRKLTAARGLKMPKIIGHEDYAMGRDQWMKKFVALKSDTMDVFGGHYYTRHRPLDKLKSDLAYAGDREKWHSELHWDEHGEKGSGTHSMKSAICSFIALWDCTDNGMNGLMWWDLNPKKRRRDHLMHAATVPLVNARPVRTVDPDGPKTLDIEELHTRTFLQGDRMTVYALNFDPDKTWKDLNFRLESGMIIGPVTGTQWSEVHPPEGVSASFAADSRKSFNATLEPGTISVFSFKFRP